MRSYRLVKTYGLDIGLEALTVRLNLAHSQIATPATTEYLRTQLPGHQLLQGSADLLGGRVLQRSSVASSSARPLPVVTSLEVSWSAAARPVRGRDAAFVVDKGLTVAGGPGGSFGA
jgi:hypothetical protein